MIDLAQLTAVTWLMLCVASLIVGFAKTAIGGLALIAVAILAATLPAKPSTGLALVLFLVGDLFAIHAYRRHADKDVLLRLSPFVGLGIVAGAVFLWLADDLVVRRTIGAILLILSLVTLVRRLRGSGTRRLSPSRGLTVAAGASSGFMSMVANAGSLAYLYLLRLDLQVLTFLGTAAWLFFAINVVKLPISIGLGLITGSTLLLVMILAPGVALGAWLGRVAVAHLSMATFEWLVLAGTIAVALNLIR